jgi:cell division protein FtsZ
MYISRKVHRQNIKDCLENENFQALSIFPKIKIVGVGGAGNNCINQLYHYFPLGVKTIAINTDSQHLRSIEADTKILIGIDLAHGMGVGGDPALGQECAKTSINHIKKLFEDVELVFLIAGMGGGTGTGAAPVIAEVAKSMDVIVIAIVTTPFKFEYGRKNRAKIGLRDLSSIAHSLLVIDNNKLLGFVPDLPVDQALTKIDNLIAEIISGLVETITTPSLINLDFADIKTIMSNGNLAMMYYGECDTLDPEEIVKNTLNNPLLNSNFKNANGALIHITGGSKLSLEMTTEITKNITKKLKPKANVILGARINPEYENEVRLLTIMTGFQSFNDGNQLHQYNTNSMINPHP